MGGASGMITPSSTSTPFSGSSMGNPNLPDMKAVMFPSDNPFAYPNQPMSTLEAQQSMGLEREQIFNNSKGGMFASSMFGRGQPPHLSFDNSAIPVYDQQAAAHQQYLQQGRQMSAPLTIGNSFELPEQMKRGELNRMLFPGDGYWAPMTKPEGERAGITTGGVNLDELFGGEGWSNIWNTQTFGRQ